jgi:hypothetical protein
MLWKFGYRARFLTILFGEIAACASAIYSTFPVPAASPSDVVSGKREISKAQAKVLAAIFHVPADLFF